ncbi:unnamed protein product, partial [Rotaria sp. Silwood1]
MASNSVEDDQI